MLMKLYIFIYTQLSNNTETRIKKKEKKRKLQGPKTNNRKKVYKNKQNKRKTRNGMQAKPTRRRRQMETEMSVGCQSYVGGRVKLRS